MAVVVVSQAWALDAGAHAEAYLQLQREFLAFMRQQPGFRGRRLLRSLEDPTHFTHLRFFDSIADYEALTRLPGYQERIAAMGAHLKPYQRYPREYMEVVLDDPA
ncbi:MAG: antibiotic biosynthesis monooxygenase [Chloroflexi bacterium]|nr:antibiotic biosynthesis monooxygenase [Chloroflexota bacterium]